MKGRIHLKNKTERKTEKSEKRKNKKPKIMKVSAHRKTILFLWMVLIASVSFGVYKNFTAIDRHTIHETTVIKEKLVDMSGIQSYVKAFAVDYFTWQNNKEAIDARAQKIDRYLTEKLQQLNTDLVRNDIPTSSSVQTVDILQVDRHDGGIYKVTFSLKQMVTEGKKQSLLVSAYQVEVHQDKNGNKVITQNPTMTANTQKSNYEPKEPENDSRVESAIVDEAIKFLKTFFTLYPKASAEELDYYVKEGVLKPIGKDLVFVELIDPLFIKEGKHLKVILSVKYLDKVTKMTQVNQYQLHIVRDTSGNWEIMG